MTSIEILHKGGPVVWVLLAYSVVALAVIVERLIHFALIGRPPKAFEQQLTAALRNGDARAAVAAVRGPEATIVQGLLNAGSEGIKALDQVASRIGSRELRRMERGFRTLEILGNTAPLLGLFGTILGMIKAFMIIEQAGGRVDAQALAGGIWEAMLTTGVGLAVSIPILLLLHVLEGMADRRTQAMHDYASVLLEQMARVPEGEEQGQARRREAEHAV